MACSQTYGQGSLFMNYMNAKTYLESHRDDYIPSFALTPYSAGYITERLQTRVIVAVLDPKTLAIIAGPYEQLTPVNYSDPNGHFPEWAYWLLGSGVIVGSAVLTIATSGAAWPVLTGAVIGAGAGAFFGGADFSNGFSWNWEDAAKGFAWGSAAGALSGALDMGESSFLTASGFGKLSTVTLKFMLNGTASLGFSKFEANAENEEWTPVRAGTAFVFGGLGSLFGGGVVSSVLWGLGFTLTEGGLGEVFDVFSLSVAPGLYHSWRAFTC